MKNGYLNALKHLPLLIPRRCYPGLVIMSKMRVIPLELHGFQNEVDVNNGPSVQDMPTQIITC